MLKAKEHSMNGLTKGIEILFKQNKVDYIKGIASLVSPNTLSIQLIDGGKSTVDAKSIIIATGSTGALSLQKVPEKMVVIGSGIIGLEMGSVWTLNGAGIDEEISVLRKQFQKSLTKQRLKFKLSTKVLSAEKKDGKVLITTEAAKDGKQGSREADVVLIAVGRQPYIQDFGVESIGVEVDSRGRIMIDNYVVYMHPEVAWVGKAEQELERDSAKYKVGRFPFFANLRVETNLDTQDQVKFLVEAETYRILGMHIIEGMLALEYGARAEDITRTTHAHPTLFKAFHF
ncbi:FAD/NAD-linked reductase [Lactarius indigo]|nr:FAD/NAD-linked reductase [Lactarius indigo]